VTIIFTICEFQIIESLLSTLNSSVLNCILALQIVM